MYIKLDLKIILLIIIFFIQTMFVLSAFQLIQPISAQTDELTCADVYRRCRESYIPDFNCTNRRIFDPKVTCCENKCPEDAISPEASEFSTLISFFGNSLTIKSTQQIPTLINLAITTILGFFSIYALGYGMYVAGVVRAKTTNEEEIVKANKTLITLILGFILAWGFIIIMQFVANLVGVGSLANLQLIQEQPSGSVVVIE